MFPKAVSEVYDLTSHQKYTEILIPPYPSHFQYFQYFPTPNSSQIFPLSHPPYFTPSFSILENKQ